MSERDSELTNYEKIKINRKGGRRARLTREGEIGVGKIKLKKKNTRRKSPTSERFRSCSCYCCCRSSD